MKRIWSFFGSHISANLVAKVWAIWWLKFGPFSGQIWTNLAAEFGPICWPNLGQFGGRSSKFFISILVLFSTLLSALFSDFRNRPSFGLPYRNENVPEITDLYFRVPGPIFAKIHRTSKMLPERIALVNSKTANSKSTITPSVRG